MTTSAPLIMEYFQLTAKYVQEYGERTVLLMQVGSFFEVYGYYTNAAERETCPRGSRMADFTRICDLNIAEKTSAMVAMDGGSWPVLMAGFKDLYLDRYVKKMQAAQYTVVVYVQDEAAKKTTRSLSAIYSPGTFLDDAMTATTLSNHISCIWIDCIERPAMWMLGIATLDIFTGTTILYQGQRPRTKEGSGELLDELEQHLTIYVPREVLIVRTAAATAATTSSLCPSFPSNTMVHTYDGTMDKYRDRIDRCEKQTYQREILQRFYGGTTQLCGASLDVFTHPLYDNAVSTAAFCFLLDFVYAHNPQLVNALHEPIFENASDRLVLANSSLRQLNMIGDGQGRGRLSSCVSLFTATCKTVAGTRMLTHQLLHPTTRRNWLEREYAMTEYLTTSTSSATSDIRQTLTDFRDWAKWKRALLLCRVSPQSFATLFDQCKRIEQSILIPWIQSDPTWVAYLGEGPEGNKNTGGCVMDVSRDLKGCMSFLASHFELGKLSSASASSVAEENGADMERNNGVSWCWIQGGVSAELDGLREQFDAANGEIERIRGFLNGLLETRETGSAAGGEFIRRNETGDGTIRLTTTVRRAETLRSFLSSEPAKQVDLGTQCVLLNREVFTSRRISAGSSTASIHFPALDSICQQLAALSAQLRRQHAAVYADIQRTFLATHGAALDRIISFVATIDVICTKAWIAHTFHYCRPRLLDLENTQLRAVGLRHPLIEQLQANYETYVSNDVSLGGSGDTAAPLGMLLYGTNAVGKTSFIKSVGVAVLMAQAGMWVAATAFEYVPYNTLFTRILGNDNMFRQQSTFAVEMSELRTILTSAKTSSLVLGDEVCSGTEATSAVAIFVAAVSWLYSANCSFMFATHFHEAAEYEELAELSRLRICHMEVHYDATIDALVYDRRLRDGAGQNMYGLEVCKSMHMPPAFIEAAYELRSKYMPAVAGHLLDRQTSRYNAAKVVGYCEMCRTALGTEVHHLAFQQNAGPDGYIEAVGPKNGAANLATVCEKCHNRIHSTTPTASSLTRRINTTRGYVIK